MPLTITHPLQADGEGEARRAVALAGRRLLAERLAARTWGNVSCRVGAHACVITPSGLGYERMTEADIVRYDWQTGETAGSRAPSSEKGVHAAAYRQFPEAGFVIHTHQTYASALGLAGFEALSPGGAEAEALGGVAAAPYGLPGTEALIAHVSQALATGAHAVLMRQHGALVVGRDMGQAFERARLLEAVCKAASRGQPEEEGPDSEAAGRLAALAEAAGRVFPHAGYTAAAPVRKAAEDAASFRAQLDDMAQMIGPRLIAVAGEEKAVLAALKRHAAVLVPGAGGLVRGASAGDCEALKLLTEKACVAYLHTRTLGVSAALSLPDALRMRFIYRRIYAKRALG